MLKQKRDTFQIRLEIEDTQTMDYFSDLKIQFSPAL